MTHDQEEALNMSDRIVVIHEGRILQSGSPREVYNNPRPLYCKLYRRQKYHKVGGPGKGDEYSRIRLKPRVIYQMFRQC